MDRSGRKNVVETLNNVRKVGLKHADKMSGERAVQLNLSRHEASINLMRRSSPSVMRGEPSVLSDMFRDWNFFMQRGPKRGKK